MSLPKVLIVDLRSQTTNNIERVVREKGRRSAVFTPDKAKGWIAQGNEVHSVILSGGDFSVFAKDAPKVPEEIFSLKRADGSPVPILGICFGHQYLANLFGGKVATHQAEFGKTLIELRSMNDPLFEGTEPEQEVWMNHHDSVVMEPNNFVVTSRSMRTGGISSIANHKRKYYGVQFHPEVTHSIYGDRIIENFLGSKISDCACDWSPISIVDRIRGEVEDGVGSGTAMLGMSGGVDSTTLAAIAAPVLKNRLHGLTVDAYHLRLNEIDEIRLHAQAASLNLTVKTLDIVDAFAHTIDAEEKREIFVTKGYLPPFLDFSREKGAKKFLQGSLAPDFIESGKTGGHMIKTHHNASAALKEAMAREGIEQLHPLRDLFKYEVRAIAQKLGLPESVFSRKPFPGPGKFLRVIGTSVTHPLLDCIGWADDEVKKILREDQKLWDDISQLVVGYWGVNTVGQKGDGRKYSGSIAYRGVKTTDYMTAEGIAFEPAIQKALSSVLTAHPLVIHAVCVPTDKPPGTIEFE
jgi:GMP synthase (glutamine-hydrolysing)